MVHAVPFVFADHLLMSGQAFYWTVILVLIALVLTDFTVDKYILG